MTAPDPLAWMADAACKGHTPLFFAEDQASKDAAKALCATCPVAATCEAYGRANHEQGIWGGVDLTERQDRRRLDAGHRFYCSTTCDAWARGERIASKDTPAVHVVRRGDGSGW